MDFNELIAFLNKKFNRIFEIKSKIYDPNDFIVKYKLFCDGSYIGLINDPNEMYEDVLYVLLKHHKYKEIF